ncbi:MAG TPA: hypothetical protein VJ779_15565 [Acetobacteraceae bacterium]|nr:hypothetical protein [Acetobacteraceae bacterium]
MAQTHSWETQNRDDHGRWAPGPGLATRENEERLGAIIESEAGGKGEAAMTAVGYTVLNRMRRRGATRVADIQRHHPFAEFTKAGVVSQRIAHGILTGAIPDPTQGATHFYTPERMPKEGRLTSGLDVGGGLETVEGVKEHGVPVRNFRPSWTKTYTQRVVRDVPENVFKFYAAPAQEHIP